MENPSRRRRRILQRTVELQPVLARIPKVELARPPRSVGGRRPRAAGAGSRGDAAALQELRKEPIHVAHENSNHRAISRMRPQIRTSPLKMKLHLIPHDGGISWVFGAILKSELKSEVTEELNRIDDRSCGQDGVHRFQLRFHSARGSQHSAFGCATIQPADSRAPDGVPATSEWRARSYSTILGHHSRRRRDAKGSSICVRNCVQRLRSTRTVDF